MDKKSIAVIVTCVILMFLWQGVLVPKYFSEQRPVPAVDTNAATTSVAGTTAVATATGGTTSGPAALPARALLSTNAPEELLVLTNENAQ